MSCRQKMLKQEVNKKLQHLPRGAGDGVPEQRISVADSADFGNARFMESFESRHSDHDFTKQLSDAVGIKAAPLRLDSQAKYGVWILHFLVQRALHLISCGISICSTMTAGLRKKKLTVVFWKNDKAIGFCCFGRL